MSEKQILRGPEVAQKALAGLTCVLLLVNARAES